MDNGTDSTVTLRCWKCLVVLGTITQHEFTSADGAIVLTSRVTILCGKCRAPETIRYDKNRLDRYKKRV